MMIRYPDVSFQTHLKKSLTPIYILIGHDSYLLNEAVIALKKTWALSMPGNVEHKRIELNWDALMLEANSYCIFSDYISIDTTWEKKSFDAKAKSTLMNYANNPNYNRLVILRAPAVSPIQCNDFNTSKQITVISVQSLQPKAEIDWIKQQLDQQLFTYTNEIPKLIQIATQGNLQAAHQTIERLVLTCEPNAHLTNEIVKTQLLDERQYKLYEISQACLEGELSKALQLMKRAQQDQIEPTLLLWCLTQELRLLEKLLCGHSYQSLKIPQFKAQLYQSARNRLSRNSILTLLQKSQHIDFNIKTGNHKLVYFLLEALVIEFSSGKST